MSRPKISSQRKVFARELNTLNPFEVAIVKEIQCKINFTAIFMLFELVVLLFFSASTLYAAHGISIDGTLKYDKDFTQFAYTSAKAEKGGHLVLHDIGSFDKMNPFTLKGASPLGLQSFVFETLAVSSLDEPFTKYGLIAKDIEVAEDKLSMVITIDESARFSDGTAVTSKDVHFSLNMMKSDKVHPLYAHYYQDVKGAEIIDQYNIRFLFSRVNRELPMIALDIPVLSENFYSTNEFDSDKTLIAPLGTGPYIVDKINQGKTISYKRNTKYWAKDKNVSKGKFNFDLVTVKYFKDQTVAVEAFKAGEYDAQLVNIAKQWVRDMKGQQFDNGIINKRIFPHKNNAGMQGFVINSRKPLFTDVRVREALGLAFDFEWTNKSIFYDQYKRNNSFFSNSYLAAKELPAGLELQYLNEFKKDLPEKVFTTPLTPPINSSKGSFRSNLRKARSLLSEAGWKINKGKLKNNKGDDFKFEILLVSPSFSRVMAPYVKNLEKLGILASYRVLDQALYEERIQNFDFDMTVHVFGQSQSPGNEQKNFWHSEAADVKGSGNLAGIKSPVVDALVDKVIYAALQEELTAACKALDRVLWYGFYVIPNWYVGGHRLVYYDKFNLPQALPKYYNYMQLIMTWWSKNK